MKKFINQNLLSLGYYQIGFDLIFLSVRNFIFKIAHKVNN